MFIFFGEKVYVFTKNNFFRQGVTLFVNLKRTYRFRNNIRRGCRFQKNGCGAFLEKALLIS